MRAPEPVVLSGHGVVLEPLAPTHAPELLVAAQDDDVWRWLPAPRPRSEDDVLQLVRTHPGDLAFAVVVDGRAQGSTSYLAADPVLGGIEVGWTWSARHLWATAVNPACKLLLLGHSRDPGARRVTLKTDALNARSRAAGALTVAARSWAWGLAPRGHRERGSGTHPLAAGAPVTSCRTPR